MKKMKLHLDDLQIDSFSTTPVRRSNVEPCSQHSTVQSCTCPGCPTCDASCNGSCGGASCIDTCAASCYGTCDVSCNGTCDYTCGGNTCDPTCAGWATQPSPREYCIFCG